MGPNAYRGDLCKFVLESQRPRQIDICLLYSALLLEFVEQFINTKETSRSSDAKSPLKRQLWQTKRLCDLTQKRFGPFFVSQHRQKLTL
ncbi:hypothetical protein TNCV_1369381 [Trichonephila clavipes]|nr:hypothetical protein TNCV_1369381 [Trichonephila clavipes]